LAIVKNGKAFMPLEGNIDKGASNGFYRKIGNTLYLALFNYDKTPLNLRVDFSRIGLSPNRSYKVTNLFTQKTTKYSQAVDEQLSQADAVLLKITTVH
jgi:alpha-galactosidase